MAPVMKTRARESKTSLRGKSKTGLLGRPKKSIKSGSSLAVTKGVGKPSSSKRQKHAIQLSKATTAPEQKITAKSPPSKKKGKTSKTAKKPQFQMVEFREYTDGRKYEARHCIALGDVPYEEHVNAADPNQDYTLALILDERTVGSERQLLPKWKGYELDPNAWEPASGLANTGALKAWEKERKKKMAKNS